MQLMSTMLQWFKTVVKYVKILSNYRILLDVTTVTFILSAEDSTLNRLDLLGALLQRFHSLHQACFCLTADTDYATFLDDYLWADRFDFLPHTRTTYQPTVCQTYISPSLSDAAQCPYIFNCTGQALSTESLDTHQQVIEWVSQHADEKTQMRRLFKQYQAQQITPQIERM